MRLALEQTSTLSSALEVGSQYQNTRFSIGFEFRTGRDNVCKYSPLFSANPESSKPGTIQYTAGPKLAGSK